MGSEATFVQLMSASRCVDELGLCGIALSNGELDSDATTRRDKLKSVKVTLS